MKDAVKVVIDKRFGALPVVEADKIVGILTSTDMLRALHELLDE